MGDGEQLKTDGSDFKLVKALLEFHPTPGKSKGMIGIKVAKAAKGDSRCFYMIRENSEEEDVSSKKCLDAVELNPPYVKQETKDDKKDEGETSPAKTPASESAPAAASSEASEKKNEGESKAEETKAADA